MLPRILELEFGMLPRIRYSMVFINLNTKVFTRLIEYRFEHKRRSTVYHWDKALNPEGGTHVTAVPSQVCMHVLDSQDRHRRYPVIPI